MEQTHATCLVAYFWNKARLLNILVLLIIFLFLGKSGNAQEETDSTKNIRWMGLVFPTHSSETGWSATGGAIMTFKTHFPDTLLRPSALYLLAMASQNKQYRFMHGGDVVMPREKWLLSYNFTFSFYTDFYYRIGQQQYTASYEKLNYRINSIYTSAAYQFKPHIFGGAIIKLEVIDRMKTDSGSVFRQQAPMGSNGYCVYGLSPRLFYDSRNNIQWASTGWYVEPIFQLYRYTADTGKIFFTTGLDVRHFAKLGERKRWVLSNQFLTQYASSAAAFRYLPTDISRGWQYNQFRDHLFWCIRNDARFKLWRGIWLAGFIDISQTAANASALKNSMLRCSAGPGFRIKLSPTQETYLRIDVGFGKENWNLYVDFSNIF